MGAVLAVLCVGSISVVAWDAWNIEAMPVQNAIALAPTVMPNSVIADGVSVRLLQDGRRVIEALNAMDKRGDQQAGHAKITLRHLLDDDRGVAGVSLEQIRGRLIGMTDVEFMAWLRRSMK